MVDSWLDQVRRIVGSRYVLTHPSLLRAYAQDGYTLASGTPAAVVLPQSTEETQRVVKTLSDAGVPIVARGAGTSLSGGAIASPGAVILHFSRMHKIHHIDWTNRIIEVDPGVVNRTITQAVENDGFFYAPDPSSQQACTIGGNFAENSGGPHCLKYGVTVNHIVMADVVLPNGELRRFGTISGGIAGPDWLGLLIGSEGTLGIATRLWLRLTPSPETRRTILALFDSVAEASQAVSDIIAAGIVPAAMEMMDHLAIAAVEKGSYPVGYPSDLAAVLLIELDGDAHSTQWDTEETIALLHKRQVRRVIQAQSDAERNLWWANRKTAFGAMGLISPRYYVQDGVIPRHVLPDALARIEDISVRHRIRIANVFHAGDGNLHPLLLYNDNDRDEIRRVEETGMEILSYCVSMKGSITGEHGIGLEKIAGMAVQFSPAELTAQTAVKKVFDPGRCFNPGKVFPTPGRCIDYSPPL
ncbi:MAG: FAD-binding oxidoreductase [Sulfobacillus acidophilus]|uniref:FAD-binding oxidoreductase n=1 Tax=Sulfobacillus acidophilus TaxID=53633 RepID=A0A2T2WCM7_9FIRM|nr:MAG: FAD-binding oxidoreductase [Sulfobacillus acidophilus]